MVVVRIKGKKEGEARLSPTKTYTKQYKANRSTHEDMVMSSPRPCANTSAGRTCVVMARAQ